MIKFSLNLGGKLQKYLESRLGLQNIRKICSLTLHWLFQFRFNLSLSRCRIDLGLHSWLYWSEVCSLLEVIFVSLFSSFVFFFLRDNCEQIAVMRELRTITPHTSSRALPGLWPVVREAGSDRVGRILNRRGKSDEQDVNIDFHFKDHRIHIITDLPLFVKLLISPVSAILI